MVSLHLSTHITTQGAYSTATTCAHFISMGRWMRINGLYCTCLTCTFWHSVLYKLQYVLGDIVSRVCICVLQQFRELIIYPLGHGEYITYHSHWLILCLLEIHTCTCVYMYHHVLKIFRYSKCPKTMVHYTCKSNFWWKQVALVDLNQRDALLTELSWVS